MDIELDDSALLEKATDDDITADDEIAIELWEDKIELWEDSANVLSSIT